MKKKKCSKAVLAAIMAMSVLASALVLPAYAANENVIIGITSGPAISAAAPGDTATVPIIVYNVTDLGASTLTVTYNSSVCTVTDVTAGDFPMLSKNISVPGLMIISALDMSGHTGDVTFANLEIKAIGSCGETSPLNISVETLKTYTDIQNIPATVSNGTFTILSGPTPSPTPTSTGGDASGGGDGGAPTDTDGDGLSDFDELWKYKTDPQKADTDGGSINDGTEVIRGTDPLDPTDDVVSIPTPSPIPQVTPVISPPVTPSSTPTPTPSPTQTPRLPVFEAIFAIAALLAVAYLVMRRRRQKR